LTDILLAADTVTGVKIRIILKLTRKALENLRNEQKRATIIIDGSLHRIP
jgi:hypothetical protein